MRRLALTAHRSINLGEQLYDAARHSKVDEVRRLLAIPGIPINYKGYGGKTALIEVAFYKKSLEILQLLLAHPDIKVNIKDNNNKTALIMATQSDVHLNSNANKMAENVKYIRALLAVPGIELNIIDKQGNTALFNTIHHNKLEEFKLLLDAGADPNLIDITNELSLTPLMEAAKSNNIEFLRTLLAIPGIEINATNHNHETALFIAVNHRQRLNVQELLKSPRIAVNIPAQGGISPILRASEINADGIIRDLLKAGAVVPEPVPRPIQIQQQLMATEQRRFEQAEFEKVLGSHIGGPEFLNAQRHLAPSANNAKEAANLALQRLITAVNRSDIDEVKRLLQVPGIKVKEDDKTIYTPFSNVVFRHATTMGPEKNIYKNLFDLLLTIPGLDPNTPVNGEPPLFISLRNHDMYAMKVFLAHPAIDVNNKTLYGEYSGSNPLMYIIETYNRTDLDKPEMKEILDIILEKRPDINAVNKDGRNVLFLATQRNMSAFVDKLLKIPGIEVNKRDNFGNSAIGYIENYENFRPIVRKLLEHGAEVLPEDPPIVQEENHKYLQEMLNKMSRSRRNPLNPNVMGEIKKFVGGKTRRLRKNRKTRRLLKHRRR